jgi:adhesin transport system membrane fusion protein
MEVMVLPRDIGFIKEGQRASVKLDSFDSARFGAVEGHVKRVAPTSTKMKENGAPFYKVEVALAKPFVGAENHRLMPGMTGEADIATGRKSVMQYLLKPIFLASDTAFHER